MNKKDENRFYVYALLDPRKPGKYKYGDICFFIFISFFVYIFIYSILAQYPFLFFDFF